MKAYTDLLEYLEENGLAHARDHMDTIVNKSLKILSEQREHPQRFCVIPKDEFRRMPQYKESDVIAQFPPPIDIEQLGHALTFLTAGIAIMTPDKIIVPYPSITITQDEF